MATTPATAIPPTRRRAESAADGAATSPAGLTATALDVVDMINEHRASAGLEPVEVDNQLAREAMRQAAVAAEVDGYPPVDLTAVGNRHPGRWGSIFANTISGPTAEEAFQSTVEDPRTRANLEKSSADVVGVGVAYAADGTTLYLVEYLAEALAP